MSRLRHCRFMSCVFAVQIALQLTSSSLRCSHEGPGKRLRLRLRSLPIFRPSCIMVRLLTSTPTHPSLNTPTRRLRPRPPARTCTCSNRTDTRTYPRMICRTQQAILNACCNTSCCVWLSEPASCIPSPLLLPSICASACPATESGNDGAPKESARPAVGCRCIRGRAGYAARVAVGAS